MKMSKFILIGILFGVTLYKSEAVSWFRIYEMFHFRSFHMYGMIFSTVAAGALIVALIKKAKIRDIEGHTIEFKDKDRSYPRYLIGGIIFGLGWALAGVCPGPMFILMGSGYTVLIVFLLSAMTGTFVYGLLRSKLPH